MNARRYLLTGLALGLSLLPRLPATTVDAPDIDSLINQSDYVVRAVVKSATAEWREHAGQRHETDGGGVCHRAAKQPDGPGEGHGKAGKGPQHPQEGGAGLRGVRW